VSNLNPDPTLRLTLSLILTVSLDRYFKLPGVGTFAMAPSNQVTNVSVSSAFVTHLDVYIFKSEINIKS